MHGTAPGDVLGVIPARYGSERLPAKPLQLLGGRPLLEWVWRRVSSFQVLDAVVVATDHPDIVALCRRIGAAVVLTDEGHPSGTDRLAEVARLPRYAGFQILVNLQGDEPLVEESHVVAAVELVQGDEAAWSLGTCATPIRDPELLADPSVVKAVRAEDGRALYFSRAPVPFLRDGPPDHDSLSRPPFLRHLGLYVYRREALLAWVALPPSPLEQVERLEQLRALEAGLPMGIAVVERAAGGVDTTRDLRIMEELLVRETGTGSTLSSSSTTNP
jgi:3-deoxy-manno-octulosonate cytidylyltransferase (CMP-KDO synthetase)